MELWMLILILILLVLDTVVSFKALFIAIKNKKNILSNKLDIAINRENIKKLKNSEQN